MLSTTSEVPELLAWFLALDLELSKVSQYTYTFYISLLTRSILGSILFLSLLYGLYEGEPSEEKQWIELENQWSQKTTIILTDNVRCSKLLRILFTVISNVLPHQPISRPARWPHIRCEYFFGLHVKEKTSLNVQVEREKKENKFVPY